jgi:hypothetical protein
MAPVLPWDDFYGLVVGPGGVAEWKQNQHLALLGPTEQGKSNMLYWLLKLRDFVTYFAIKPKDATLMDYAETGDYELIREWPPMKSRILMPPRQLKPAEMPRRLLWPEATEFDAEVAQEREFSKAVRDIYVEGGWCTVWDDYWYIVNILGMLKDSKKMLLNARSNDIPFVLATQRVAGHRNVEIFDQSTHLLFFRDTDERNLKTIGGVANNSNRLIQAFVSYLDPYQALYVNTRQNGLMYRTTAPLLEVKARKKAA